MQDGRYFYLVGKPASSELKAGVRNPFNGEMVAEVCQANAEQVERAIAGMVEAYAELRRWPSWRRTKRPAPAG